MGWDGEGDLLIRTSTGSSQEVLRERANLEMN